MVLTLAFIIVAAPLADGPHRCGTQWDAYSEVCTLTTKDGVTTVSSTGPGALFDGTIKPAGETSFDLSGKLTVIALPFGYSAMMNCAKDGAHAFRQTGKRKYFRYTLTCTDMTTTYFDIFVDVLAPEDATTDKPIAALVGKSSLAFPSGACQAVDLATVKAFGDARCERYRDSGHGYPYYECADGDNPLIVFEKPKHCSEARKFLDERLKGE